MIYDIFYCRIDHKSRTGTNPKNIIYIFQISAFYIKKVQCTVIDILNTFNPQLIDAPPLFNPV